MMVGDRGCFEPVRECHAIQGWVVLKNGETESAEAVDTTGHQGIPGPCIATVETQFPDTAEGCDG